MSIPRFLVGSAAFAMNPIELTGKELHHLRVRRIRAGSILELVDGLGIVMTARLLRIGDESALLEPLAPANSRQTRESPLQIILAPALLKGNHMDLVIEKACELGVGRVLPIKTMRTVIGGASASRMERWNRIARAAVKQCGRTLTPAIEEIQSLNDLIDRSSALADVRLLAAEPGLEYASAGRSWHSLEAPRSVLLLVGPEGGFADEEASAALGAGFERMNLGPRILRAETAAIAAVTHLQVHWGDMAASPKPGALPAV